MKTRLLIVNFLLLAYCVCSQDQGNSIEGEFYFRYDKYPAFSYSPNPTRMHKVNSSGTSFGAALAYRLQMQQRFFLKAGIGYCKYSFSKMKVYDPIFGETNARLTLYMPQNTRVYLATPKYWYNCISINIVPEYHFALGKNWLVATGLGIKNYLTFSQVYSFKNIESAKSRRFHYQGYSISGQFSFFRQSGKVMFGPRIIVPFFDCYKQDNIFPSENNSLSRSKWFQGLGLGISCAYSLKK
ncbi:hypothetical protein [Agriterribacter sp.]|uniref:hypothetical protein n=1 Tax=Agriterribacter sp. TaxID=2821509 RepID=UPI002C4831E5|nr:hypothetical protein [Agriterribacter sp.]HTN08572.1 hypothetical protein [Agriterribacter sp.]